MTPIRKTIGMWNYTVEQLDVTRFRATAHCCGTEHLVTGCDAETALRALAELVGENVGDVLREFGL